MDGGKEDERTKQSGTHVHVGFPFQFANGAGGHKQAPSLRDFSV